MRAVFSKIRQYRFRKVLTGKRISLLALCLLSFATANAQYGPVVSSDESYRIHEVTPQFRIIYSQDYAALVPEMESYSKWFLQRYEKEFQWKLDQKFDVILASGRNQIPNGFVTSFPNLYSTFYNGSAEFLEEFASISWLYDLLSHEYVHAYQINAKGEWGKILRSVLKNPSPAILPPFTYTLYPHLFTPTFIMEGNATFNEGRFGNGGRLHSGLYRALFLQMLRDGKVTANRLMNDHLEWPYGAEKYIIGGYLQSHLAEKYGVEKTNSFFARHARREFFPFNLKDSFEDVFDEGYNASIKDLNNQYRELAQSQQSAAGTQIADSQSHTALTKVDGHITFMRTNMKSELELCQWKSTQASLCCKSVRMPFGRVFKYKGKWATSAYESVTPTLYQAGLYKEGYKSVPEFKNKYLFAIDEKHRIYADVKSSFKEVTLYDNGTLLGTTQSSPFLSSAGDVYFFKQDRDGRHLYKNTELLTTINGYYGRVVDVSVNGDIYFLGSVQKGSALFVYTDGKIQRAHPSDLIVDAMLTGQENQVLITEVTNKGYVYKISELQTAQTTVAPLTEKDSLPEFYNYKFDSKEDQAIFTSIPTETSQPTDKDEKYRPFHEMEYSGLDTSMLLVDPDGFVGFFDFRFSDPLQRYQTSFSLRDSGWGTPGARLSFINAKNRLAFQLIADYGQVPHVREKTNASGDTEYELIGKSSEANALAGFIYPLLSTSVWDSKVSLSYLYENENPDDDSVANYVDRKNSNLGILSYDISYSFAPGGLSYGAQQKWYLDLNAKVEGEKSAWKPKSHAGTAEFGVRQNLFWDFYFSSNYKAGLAEGDFASLELNDDSLLAALDPTEFNALGTQTTKSFYQLRRVNAEIKRPFYLGWYHRSFPLGLWRLAPVAGYYEYYGSTTRHTAVDTLFHQSYYGAEVEILFLHKFPVRLTYLNVNQDDENKSQVMLGLQKSF